MREKKYLIACETGGCCFWFLQLAGMVDERFRASVVWSAAVLVHGRSEWGPSVPSDLVWYDVSQPPEA